MLSCIPTVIGGFINDLNGDQAEEIDATSCTVKTVSNKRVFSVGESTNLSVDGATVTAAAGYYSSAASKTVSTTTHPNPTASITSSTGVVTATHTQSTGYVTSGTTTGTLSLTTKAAATIYPSTTDQTISSYRWLTGTQTIKSVTTSNLTASNIASGVIVKVGDANNASRISQVTGTYAPAVSALTVTPTESQQTFNATGVYGYKPVTVNGISSTYVGTGITQRSSANTTFASATGTFTAPAGYYSAAATNTITTQAAQTITPGTTSQYINSYRWLTGSQTIKGDANLVASNIADGVSIFGVSGTHQGGGNKYTCTIYGNGNAYNNYLEIANNTYYSEGTVMFSPGETLLINARGTQGGGIITINGSIVADTAYQAAQYSIVLPHCDIEATLLYGAVGQITISTPTIYISNNGMYDVGSYASANVSVAGGGFTADEIAMRTIFGDISGNATYIGNDAFASCSALTTASFPSVTSIGSYAFNRCTSLTTVSFPNATYINSTAFAYCTSLTTVSFPNATSIGNYAFISCSRLTTADFPSVTSIGSSAFQYCSSLTTVSFSNATYIGGYAFAYCTSLTTVSFPSVTSISSYAFYCCSSLTTTSFPSVTSIGGSAFQNCRALTIASFPNAISIGTSAFVNCSRLTTASFPSATSIGSYAFYYCSSLTTVSFPSATSIGGYAFNHCDILTTASFPNVTSIGNNVFRYCFNLLSFYLLGSSVPTLGTSVFTSTPIDGYTTSTGGVYGSIFVPSSLYATYTTATNWSDYAARIVSV